MSELILDYEKVSQIEECTKQEWLIEYLWAKNACGIIGGQPKCCKSWLGLDMAVSIASQTPCLNFFQVHEKGSVLVFMAEDRIEEVKRRIQEISLARNISINELELYIIKNSSIMLDSEDDCKRLENTVEKIRPKLLLLDPFVRMHRCDENSAKEVSHLLSNIRRLERDYNVSVILTHHSSKRLSSRPGQALRGSSDFHAFGDSNIYLSRENDELKLTVEHRTSKSIDPFIIELNSEKNIHLKIKNSKPLLSAKNQITVHDRIMVVLQEHEDGISRKNLREILRISNDTLGKAIKDLLDSCILINSDGKLLCHKYAT